MKRVLMTASALAILTSPAFAGALGDPVVAEVPVAAPAAAPVGADWTGAYAGVQLGNIDIDGDGAADGDDVFYGAHIGYNYDFGQFVLGGEIDFDTMDVDLGGAADVDSAVRLKLRAGADLGQALLYVTAGAVQIDTSLGDGDGYFAGLGMAFAVSESILIGAEILTHEFDDIGNSGVDASADTISLRVSFRF